MTNSAQFGGGFDAPRQAIKGATHSGRPPKATRGGKCAFPMRARRGCTCALSQRAGGRLGGSARLPLVTLLSWSDCQYLACCFVIPTAVLLDGGMTQIMLQSKNTLPLLEECCESPFLLPLLGLWAYYPNTKR